MGNLPRLMIAGTHSGVGKTTITVAVMAMLTRAGYRVQPFKVGPDYIDPGIHRHATGRISRNLDAFFLGHDGVREVFVRAAANADISIIEGVMGLYDGIGSGDEGSSAQVAKLLNCPVILVLDARSMAHSAAALVWGFAHFPGSAPIAGIIINRVGSKRHYELLKQAIEEKTGITVLGGILRNQEVEMPQRHLGLLPGVENKEIQQVVGKLAMTAMADLPAEKLFQLAQSAPVINAPSHIFAPFKGEPVQLGIVMDSAFNFYYQDGLDLLEHLGAALVPCSPLEQEQLPSHIDGLYIGGGFPEMFVQKLTQNQSFAADLRSRAADGLPVFAECGGLMYLCRSIINFEGQEYPGVGLIPARCRMGKKRAALGYVQALALTDNIVAAKGASLKGHEFHYSTIDNEELNPAYQLCKADGSSGHLDGHVNKNILATYLHIHFAGAPQSARRFLLACAAYRRKQGEVS